MQFEKLQQFIEFYCDNLVLASVSKIWVLWEL